MQGLFVSISATTNGGLDITGNLLFLMQMITLSKLS